ILLLDEPLSALDAKLRESMQVEIRQLQQRLNITTILVTHDQREAMTMADIVVVLGEHRVQQVGTPIEIYRHPANEFVADFIGSGNIFPATTLGSGRVGLPGGDVLDVPASRSPIVGEKIKLLVRPEDVQLSTPQATAGNRLLGKVTFVRDIGATIETTVECSGVSFTALSTPCQGMDLGIGHAVSVTLPADACRLLEA
ncbi:ABC transporter ATP-binding protein, partial [Pseudomonas corrugata]